MYERSYVVSSDGNVSVRLDDGRILATPTMTCKGRMTEDLIAITDLEGRALNDRRASSELAMHLLIYRERPDVRAVCHAHPPHGTAFAVAGLAIDQPILSEVILTLGCVPLASYGTPSTDELTEAMQALGRQVPIASHVADYAVRIAVAAGAASVRDQPSATNGTTMPRSFITSLSWSLAILTARLAPILRARSRR